VTQANIRAEDREIVDALFSIVVASRRLSRSDSVDSGAVRLLWHLDEVGSCRVSTLAALSGLDLSTVSRHVRELVDSGYVERSPDSRDRRAVVVAMTPRGRAVLDESVENRVAALAPVLDSWSQPRRDQLLRLLRTLSDDLTAASRAACPAHHLEDSA
jgi:DNA-binding MarR family transcriptional regulator